MQNFNFLALARNNWSWGGFCLHRSSLNCDRISRHRLRQLINRNFPSSHQLHLLFRWQTRIGHYHHRKCLFPINPEFFGKLTNNFVPLFHKFLISQFFNKFVMLSRDSECFVVLCHFDILLINVLIFFGHYHLIELVFFAGESFVTCKFSG